jgi:tetratricopeptide (TPR) repeat protein
LRRVFTWRAFHPAELSDQEANNMQNYLGAVLYDQKRFAEALTEWRAYIAKVTGDRATWIDIARAHTSLNQPAEAADALRQALRMKRDDADLLAQLARSLLRVGGREATLEALNLFREALSLQPTSQVIRFDLAQALGTTGRTDEAVLELRALLDAHPGWPPAVNNLAWILATGPDPSLRHGEEAVRLAESIRNPQIVFTLGTLSAAYAEAGRFPDALCVIDEAIALEQAKPESSQLTAFRAMRAVYTSRQPYRDPQLVAQPSP